MVLATGGLVARDLADGDGGRRSEIAGQEAADPYGEYAGWGAWATGRELTVGATTVTLAGVPQPFAQTSIGVVVREVADDGRVGFSLVGPEGIVRRLSIPASAPTIDGDPTGHQVAWLEPGEGQGTVHVWDVVHDREVGAVTVDLPGSTPEGGRSVIRPVVLNGYAFVGTDQGTTLQVEWSTGDTGTWQVVDIASGEVVRTIGRRLESARSAPGPRTGT